VYTTHAPSAIRRLLVELRCLLVPRISDAVRCYIKEDYDLASAAPLYFWVEFDAQHIANFPTSLVTRLDDY
jgi:hypothetical protein